VLSLLGRMRLAGVALEPRSLNEGIWACEDRGLWQVALGLLNELRTGENVTADAFSYNAAISACEKAGELEQVEPLLDEMHETYTRPDMIKLFRLQKVSALSDEELHSILQKTKEVAAFRRFGGRYILDVKVDGKRRIELDPPYEVLQPLVNTITELAETTLGDDEQLAIIQLIINFYKNGGDEVAIHTHRCRQICASLGASRDLKVSGQKLKMCHGDALYLGGEFHSVLPNDMSDPRISVCLFYGSSEEFENQSISVNADDSKFGDGAWWNHPQDLADDLD